MLSENGLQEGSEIKLVPCVESGVNTPLTMDPVAMMKHSMSNISDQQVCGSILHYLCINSNIITSFI
jgi:hypothetical protein